MFTQVDEIFEDGGIPINLVNGSNVNIDLLQCPICFNLLWKPIACGQDRCFSSFCQHCIESWLNQRNESTNFDDQDIMIQKEMNCPKCKRPFIKTEIPLMKILLSQIELKCIHQDCQQLINYSYYEDHIIKCSFRKKQCKGCQKQILQCQLINHEEICPQMPNECQQCHYIMPKKTLEQQHTKSDCITNQFHQKDEQLANVADSLMMFEEMIEYQEQKLENIFKGELQQIKEYYFFTIFANNYAFTNDNLCIARLVRNSYNYAKQKNDYLHFYVDHQFTTGLEGYEWKIRIIRLRGNLLIGICSSQLSNSVDYIINRQGEIKKKEENDNRYHIIRKVNFTFGEGDIIKFQYMPLMQCLRIMNETRHLIFCFDKNELQEIGELYFSFFSLEYQGDAIQFL